MCTTQGFQKSKEGFSININFNLICNTLSSNRRLIRKGKIIIELTSHQKIKNHHRIYVSSENDKLWTTCFKYEISLWHHLLLNSYDMPWVNVQSVFMCCWILMLGPALGVLATLGRDGYTPRNICRPQRNLKSSSLLNTKVYENNEYMNSVLGDLFWFF